MLWSCYYYQPHFTMKTQSPEKLCHLCEDIQIVTGELRFQHSNT